MRLMRFFLLFCLLVNRAIVTAQTTVEPRQPPVSPGTAARWSVQAQAGLIVALPFTNARYTYPEPVGSQLQPRTERAVPGPFFSLPLEISGQYALGKHLRLGLGVKQFGIRLASHSLIGSLDELTYKVKGSAVVPFGRADLVFISSAKSDAGVSLQAGPLFLGGGVTGVRRAGYFSYPVFYERHLTERLAVSLDFYSIYAVFHHDSWFGDGKRVRTSIIGYGARAGLLVKF